MHLLAQHPQLRDAAAVADLFKLDPVDVLDEPDPRRRAIRLAAFLARRA